MLVIILREESTKNEEISSDEIITESLPIIDKIGDFLFDMLKLNSQFLRDSIEIYDSNLEKNKEFTIELENKYGSDVKIEHETLKLSLPKQHVNQVLNNGILIYITERKVRHTIVEAPSWIKGLREEKCIEFELDEDFVEEADPENDIPSIMFKVAKKKNALYNFLYAVSRGILIFIKSSK